MEKIALIYTGITEHPTRQIYDFLCNIYGVGNIECMVFTWSGMNSLIFNEVFSFAKIYEFNYNDYHLEIISTAEYFKFNAPEITPNNTIAMFKLWSLASLVLNNTKKNYRFAFKGRVDNEITIPTASKLGFNDSHLSIPTGGDYRNGIGDHVCFGSPENVIRYLSTYNSLKHIAASGAVLHPEALLRTFLRLECSNAILRPAMDVMCRNKQYNNKIDKPGYSLYSRNIIPNPLQLAIVGKYRSSYQCRGLPNKSFIFERLISRIKTLLYRPFFAK